MNTKHGHTVFQGPATRTYNCWRNLLQRIRNPNNKDYHIYGGKGITVCDRRLDFRNFLADMGECPEGFSIERKNNNQGYSPENCEWIPFNLQGRNRSVNRVFRVDGEEMLLVDVANMLGKCPKSLRRWLNRGWSIEQVIDYFQRTKAKLQ